MTAHQPIQGNFEDKKRWEEKPVVASVLRLVVSFTPTVASFLATHILSRTITPDALGMHVAYWWILLISVGMIVLILTDKAMKLFLPLVALFKLSLIFPDEAPSRFRIAMKTGTTKSLERKVSDIRKNGLPDDGAKHAELLLQMVAALSKHDRLTRGHCERVRAYTDMIAEEMGLSDEDASRLRWAALLHDVGKLFVPAEILNKDGKPTDVEWDILKSHTWQGEKLVKPLVPWLGEWSLAVGSHHERWDGGGYPRGLSGTDIHLGARIVSVADTFDVITSKRSYKEPISADKAREEIARCAGGQFDPAVVRAFLNIGLGRLKFAIGPLSWLANLPAAGQASIAPLSSPVATAAIAVMATGAAVSTNNLDMLIANMPEPETLAYVDEETEEPAPDIELADVLILEDVNLTMAEDTPVLGEIGFTTLAGPITLSTTSEPRLGTIELDTVMAEARPGTETSGSFEFTYRPTADRSGRDSFGYQICDETDNCRSGTASIEITSVNDAPTVSNPSDAVAASGRSVQVQIEASDVEGDELTFEIRGLPDGLTYSPSTGEISGTVSPTATPGSHTVTVVVKEARPDGLTASTEFTIVVPDPGDPAAIGYPVSTFEDTPVSIELPAVSRGQSLKYSIVGSPANGTLGSLGQVRSTTLNNGDRSTSVTYTPRSNFAGNDQFDFRVCSPTNRCSQATIRITVTSRNDAPVVSPISDLAVSIGASVVVPIRVSDVEGSVTASVSGLPAWLTYNPGSLTISGVVPNGAAALSTIRVTATDTGSPPLSSSRTFSIRVVAAPPLARPASMATPEDTAASTSVDATTQSGPLTFSIPPGQTIHGQASFATPRTTGQVPGTESTATNTLEFTPDPDYNGTTIVRYTVCDSAQTCSTDYITITVSPVNDLPTVGSPSFSTPEDSPFTITDAEILALASDVEGGVLTLSWTGVTNGTITDLGTSARFIPNLNYNGPATLQFEVCDDRNACTTGQVDLTINPANDPPDITNPGPQTAIVGDTINLVINASDLDGDPVTFAAFGLPTGLTIDPNTGVISGVVDGAVGQGSFVVTVKAHDPTSYTPISFDFTIDPDIRSVQSLGATTDEDTAVQAFFEGATTYGNLTFNVGAGPSHGTVTNLTPSSTGASPFVLSAFFGNFDYDPDPDYFGPDSVTIEIRDQATGTLRANIVVPLTVNSVNDQPVISPPADQTLVLGSSVSIPVTATDVEADTITYSAVGLPPGLSIDPSTGLITGTVANNSVQSVYPVEVSADDGSGPVSGSFVITLDIPAAQPEDVLVVEDTTTTITISITTRFSAEVTVLTPPANGTVTGLPLTVGDSDFDLDVFNFTFDYTPNPDTFGQDSVVLRACNTVLTGVCLDLLIPILVTPVNDAPVVNSHPDIVIVDGQAVSVPVTASDVDGDILTYSAAGLPPGLSIDPTTGEISGTPNLPGSPATYNSSITVTDSGSPAKSASVTYTFVVN